MATRLTFRRYQNLQSFDVLPRALLRSVHFYSSRLFATQQSTIRDKEKTKKDKRRDERKQIIGEITKGYFADFHEFRKTGGKRYFARDKLFDEKDSVVFPAISAKNLKKTEINLVQEFPNHITLVLLWFRAIGQSMCDKYRTPFIDHFSREPTMQYYEINVVDGWFLRTLKPFITRSLTKQKPADRHENYLCYFGDTKILKKKLIENIIVGHAYLVDSHGRVRWKGHANPTEEEIRYMLECSEELLKESKKSDKRNILKDSSVI